MPPTSTEATDRVKLKPTLRPLQVASLALGCIIGFGCFVLPGDFLAMAGPLGAAIGVAVGGVAMIIIARSYGVLVRTQPVAGGEFAYAYHAGGRYHAYICGWLLTLGYLSIVPLNATALAVLGKFIAPHVFAQGYLYSIAGFDVYTGEIVLASAAMILLGYFQYRGVSEVGVIQAALAATLAAAVFVVALGTELSDQAALANLRPHFPTDRSPVAAALAIVAISPWLFVGFDTLPQAAEEFDFPPRLGQRLMVGAIAAGALMYVIVILATSLVMPWQDLLATNSIWATGTTVQMSLGTFGLTFLGIAVCAAILTGINGFYMATSRLLFSMGRAKVLPAWFARVHPTRHTPHNAILFTGLVSLVAPWLGREVILWIVDMSAVGTSVGYLYTCVAALIVAQGLSRREAVPYKVFAALGATLSAGFLVLLLVPGMPAFMAPPSWIALAAWVALGTIFFLIKRAQYRAIPGDELDYLILGKGVTRDTSAAAPEASEMAPAG